MGQGIVESLARPTGNVTGFSNLEFSLIGKWLQLLKEIAPGVTRVALMISTSNAVSANWFRMFDTLAPAFAIEPVAAPIRERADIESGLETLARMPNGGLIVPGDVFVEAPSARRLIVDLAASHRLPACTPGVRSSQKAGSCPTALISSTRTCARHRTSIVSLRGETPADLPVQQPTKFEFVINLKTAKALGLAVPMALQAGADEVIE